jgi:hypothetical protein
MGNHYTRQLQYWATTTQGNCYTGQPLYRATAIPGNRYTGQPLYWATVYYGQMNVILHRTEDSNDTIRSTDVLGNRYTTTRQPLYWAWATTIPDNRYTGQPLYMATAIPGNRYTGQPLYWATVYYGQMNVILHRIEDSNDTLR